MPLVASMITWVGVHVGCGLAMAALLYLGGGIISYGGEYGFLGYTPLAGIMAGAEGEGRIINALDLRGLFAWVVNLGNVVWGLLSFEYGFLDWNHYSGFFLWVMVLLRLGVSCATFWLGGMMVQTVFSSGLMNSTAGLAVVATGTSITGILAALGAID